VRAPVAAIAFAILLAGCKVFETTAPAPQVSTPEAFDEVPANGARFSSQDLARWWTVWRDPILNRFIRDALDANTDLRIAQARVNEARSLATIAESALYPTVGAQAGQWGGAAQWRNPLVTLIPGGSHTFDAHLAGVAATWEPDIFEGRADDAEAARAAALSVEEQLNGARTIVVAEVAENYQEARGLQRRLAVLDASIAAFEQLLRYAEARYAAGQALAYDVTEVRERLESQRAKRPVLVSLIDTRERRLAVLKGRVPEKIEGLPPPGGFTAPPVPSGQMPSDVLERRPDVRARALLVRAQVATLSSAKTDLLPRFQVNFFGGDGRLHFEGLPGLQGTGGLAGLTVQLPIYTAGRIEANIAANDARLEQAAADHDKSVLQALEEVEGAYGRRVGFDKRGADIRQALENARRNEKASIGLYEGGRKTFDDAVKAKLDAFERNDELIETQMGQAAATVQLYLALGGGW
jgi:NodT family efflux transporter outer membrane factor (OMF) lipoprotein